MPPTKHSHFGASSAYRWITCPGSVALCASVSHPKKSSTYADEGTAAHELAETSLLNRRMPKAFLGRVITINGVGYVVDDEMVSNVTVYVRKILEVASVKNNPGLVDSVQVETKFDLDWIGRPGMWGTCDASLADTVHRKLHVFDLKYGAGVPVYAENNWQLMYYALGLLGKHGIDKFDTVRLVIVQPRCEESGVTEWEIPISALLDWRDRVLIPAYDEAYRPDARLVPSEKGCKWCAGKHICPALAGGVMRLAGNDMGDSVQVRELPRPDMLSDEQLIKILDFMPLVKPFFEAVAAHALDRALQGDILKGFKLVEGRKGNRQWADERAVEEAFSFVGEDIYEKKLRSPAQMEKLLGKSAKNQIDAFTTRADAKLMLVPESDKRQAVSLEAKTALAEFFGDSE